MERVIILKNTESGQALTLPVTPSSYPMAAGRAAERLDMAQTGQITLPGLSQLFSEQLEFMLPAQRYPFLTSGATADPAYYIELLTNWSVAAEVCRYIVTGTDINSPVLLGLLEYGEQDGTNDVYCKLPLYEYRYLDEVRVEKYTQNNGRASEAASQPEKQASAAKTTKTTATAKKVVSAEEKAAARATVRKALGFSDPKLVQSENRI